MSSERRTKENLESGPPPSKSLVDALDAIPIFPLPQVVLFPNAVLPLHVFEPRYRAMLADCLASHGALVIAQLLAGEDEHGRPRIAPVAGGGIVVEHQPLPDGRSNIVVRGQARLRLEELDPEDPPRRAYRVARATVLHDLPVSVPERERTALAAAATMFAGEVKKHDPTFNFKLPQTTDAGELADLCAYQLVIDSGSRQAVLEEPDPRARVEMVLNHLALQHGAMMKADGDRVLN
jgi:ATP-dependent Lon protease